MLTVTGLTARYGAATALDGIDLTVDWGEAVVLLGANGAGKSTTLMSLSGTVKGVSGSIVFDGREILGKPAHVATAMGIAQVPEGRRVFKNLTIEENLCLGAYRRRVGARQRLDRIYQIFPILAERRRHQANSLSGGQQQMLAIGRALMSEPKLLLLDEPSLGLAPAMIAEIYRSIRSLHESGVTLLLVEQNVELALSVGSRGYLLERGRVTLAGSAAELRLSKQLKASYLGGQVDEEA